MASAVGLSPLQLQGVTELSPGAPEATPDSVRIELNRRTLSWHHTAAWGGGNPYISGVRSTVSMATG